MADRNLPISTASCRWVAEAKITPPQRAVDGAVCGTEEFREADCAVASYTSRGSARVGRSDFADGDGDMAHICDPAVERSNIVSSGATGGCARTRAGAHTPVGLLLQSIANGD